MRATRFLISKTNVFCAIKRITFHDRSQQKISDILLEKRFDIFYNFFVDANFNES